MKNFVCKKCGYRFQSLQEKPKICPYCSKESVTEEQGAEELLDEVEKILR